MDIPVIIRKRIIPDEEVELSNDECLFYSDEAIVTRWLPLKPRTDIGWGLSYTDILRNYKISEIYDPRGVFMFWYCDMVRVTVSKPDNKYIIKDLLLDLKVYKDRIEVLDKDELYEAYDSGLITEEERDAALAACEYLKNLAEEGRFPPWDAAEMKFAPPKAFAAE